MGLNGPSGTSRAQASAGHTTIGPGQAPESVAAAADAAGSGISGALPSISAAVAAGTRSPCPGGLATLWAASPLP
eukprot:1140778-Pelagomonas_calceolata.AAC.3